VGEWEGRRYGRSCHFVKGCRRGKARRSALAIFDMGICDGKARRTEGWTLDVLSVCLGVLGAPAVCALGLFVGRTFRLYRNSMKFRGALTFQERTRLPFTPGARLHKVGRSHCHRALRM
jgi:hypothetical protein